MGCKRVLSRIVSPIFQYETVKFVSIKSKKVGLTYRFLQLVIMGYVIGYVIVYKKGYQDTEIGTSSIISKVKGVSYANRSNGSKGNVWDVADYVVPPQEDNAFFITTNALITWQQKQDKCPEDINSEGAQCKNNSDCISYDPVSLGNGIKTGKCINNSICEVYAWCPVESSEQDAEIIKSPLLKNVYDFSVYIKNNVLFRKFNVARSNVPSTYNKTQLRSCRYDPINDPKCPVFTIGTILKLAKTEYNDIANIGGVISFSIMWDCNLDDNIEKCFPIYKFYRLDSEEANISKGWNFRHANYYYMNDIQYRDLIKAYGIRFIISVSSKAGKFSIIPLTMNLGSGVALLAIASVICDIIVLYCLKSREKYVTAKYHYVSGEDPYMPFDSDLHEDSVQEK